MSAYVFVLFPVYMGILFDSGHFPAQRHEDTGKQLYRLEVVYGLHVLSGLAVNYHDILLFGGDDAVYQSFHD